VEEVPQFVVTAAISSCRWDSLEAEQMGDGGKMSFCRPCDLRTAIPGLGQNHDSEPLNRSEVMVYCYLSMKIREAA
jgi:hypothetical protein